MSEWVCSVCGSSNIASVQQSVDPRYPLGFCVKCNHNTLPPGKDAPAEQWEKYIASLNKKAIRNKLVPLMSAEQFAKRQRSTKAEPEDLFGDFEESAFAVRPTHL